MENHVSPLPLEIVEHTLSFLNGKEGARTAILSKHFYNAWSTRPNLNFDDRCFRAQSRDCRFWLYMKNTLKRYEASKLKIDTFTLRAIIYLAMAFLRRAVKLGAAEIRIVFYYVGDDFVFPDEIFRSETLARLHITGGRVVLKNNVEVTRSKLESIHFSRVEIDGDFLRNLILRCPSLENVVCDLVSDCEGSGYSFHKVGNSLLLYNLRSINSLFFENVLMKFPCLENLCIRYVYDCEYKQIRSESIERISVVEYNRAVNLEFDVPNLRKFHFEGSALSRLAFTPPCRDWESDIGIMCYQASASWLSSLRRLLTNLSLSKVSLSLHVKFPSKYICDYMTTTNEHIPEVENLDFLLYAPNAGLLDGLFMICRPKLVSQHCFAQGSNGLLELLCKKFVDERSENHCNPNPNMHGLEEVNVECFEESLAEWRPLPWKTLLDASTDPGNSQQFRFRLRWGTG